MGFRTLLHALFWWLNSTLSTDEIIGNFLFTDNEYCIEFQIIVSRFTTLRIKKDLENTSFRDLKKSIPALYLQPIHHHQQEYHAGCRDNEIDIQLVLDSESKF